MAHLTRQRSNSNTCSMKGCANRLPQFRFLFYCSGTLRVLDVMAGSGMRGARYLAHADADMVWVNDYNPGNQQAMVFNVCSSLLNAAAGNAAAGAGGDGADTDGRSSPTAVGSSHAAAAGIDGSDSCGERNVLAELAGGRRLRGSRVHLPGMKRDIWEWAVRPDAGAPPEAAGSSATAAVTGDSAVFAVGSGGARSAGTDGSSSAGSDEDDPGVPQFDQSTAAVYANLLAATLDDATTAVGTLEHDSMQQAASCSTSAAADSALQHAAGNPPQTADSTLQQTTGKAFQQASGKRVRVSSSEANRLLCSAYLVEDFYDLIDVDAFGSDVACLPAAIDAVKFGGLLYLTSTDGFGSGKRNPSVLCPHVMPPTPLRPVALLPFSTKHIHVKYHRLHSVHLHL